MKIIVLNLNRKTKIEQVEHLFKKHGNVESCELVMDLSKNQSKGFGFVEMENEEQANKAIEELHGFKLDNQKIRVKVSSSTKKI